MHPIKLMACLAPRCIGESAQIIEGGPEEGDWLHTTKPMFIS